MPKLSDKKARQKVLTDWKELSDEVGLAVISVLEAGGYIAFWHNYQAGLTVRVMYENEQETFSYDDPDEYRTNSSELDAWLKDASKPKEKKRFSSTAYEKAKGR